MGPNASTMLNKFQNQQTYEARHPLWVAKSMLKQLLLGSSFLPQNGVIHAGAYFLLMLGLDGKG